MIFKKADIIKMVVGLVDSCKDKSPDDIKNEVIKTIAETVHADNGNDIVADKDAEIDDLKAQIEALSEAYDKLASEKK
jgi:ubiquinone biosynthesis protein UbiJ